MKAYVRTLYGSKKQDQGAGKFFSGSGSLVFLQATPAPAPYFF